MAHLKALGRRSHVDAAGIFKGHVTGAWPKLVDTPAADLTADDVLDMQRRLIEHGKGRTANKLRSYLHAAYQCAIDVRMSAALAKGRPGQGPRAHVLPLLRKAASVVQEFERHGEYVMTITKGRRPIEATTVTGWAHDAVGDAIVDFQLKRIRSGVETLLAANGISREIREHLQSHGLTGVQARHYDGHDYMPEKRHALEALHAAIDPPKHRRTAR